MRHLFCSAHLMFWTDWGRNPRIERASMDGKLRTVIISNKLYWPNGLTIDYPNNLLYFADAYLDFIDFCDYNGNNRKQVLASDLVSLWEKWLYVELFVQIAHSISFWIVCIRHTFFFCYSLWKGTATSPRNYHFWGFCVLDRQIHQPCDASP